MQSCATLRHGRRQAGGRDQSLGPRFNAGGVHPGDFDRITSALGSWDDWGGGWSQAAAGHEELGCRALAQGRTRSAGGHLAQAAVYYH